MKGQIQHLINLAEFHHVTLQLVPTMKGAYAGLPGAFMVLYFRDDPDAVHVEGHVGAQLIDHPDVVRRYGVRFDLIRSAALTADDTLDVLRTILESL